MASAAMAPAVHPLTVEAEAALEIASFLQAGHAEPGVDLPMLRARLNQLRARAGAGGGAAERPVLFPPEQQRSISE